MNEEKKKQSLLPLIKGVGVGVVVVVNLELWPWSRRNTHTAGWLRSAFP